MWLIYQIAVGVFLGVTASAAVLWAVFSSYREQRVTVSHAMAVALPSIIILATVLSTEGPPPQWRWLFEDKATAATDR